MPPLRKDSQDSASARSWRRSVLGLRRRNLRPLQTAFLGAAAVQKLRLRPQAPLYWRNITPRLLRGGPAGERRFELWLLVLEAKGLSFFPAAHGQAVYVPPVLERVAVREITEFERERPAPEMLPQTGKENWFWVLAFLALLACWSTLRWGEAAALPVFFPALPKEWLEAGGLMAERVQAGEWWRVFTSLTLHGDMAHLLGNCVFGAFFLILLCRRAGLGLGLFLCLYGGALGNLCDAWFRPAAFISIGFSTALFAALGALCALAGLDKTRRGRSGLGFMREYLLPLGAGLALLAFMGGSTEADTDYAAHVFGLVCGAALGFGVWLTRYRSLRALASGRLEPALSFFLRRPFLTQGLFLGFGLGALVISWALALSAFQS